MAGYKKCPRCDLNWIPSEESYCDVCKIELHLDTDFKLLDEVDEFEEELLCPICKVNYITEDEDMCAACKLEKEEKEATLALGDDEDFSLNEVYDDSIVADEDDVDLISLSDMEEEEENEESDWDDEEMNEDDEDFDDLDDFDDLEDFEDDDEDEELID